MPDWTFVIRYVPGPCQFVGTSGGYSQGAALMPAIRIAADNKDWRTCILIELLLIDRKSESEDTEDE